MDTKRLGQSCIEISRVGIGGHYKAMEEGMYEDRYAYVNREIENRIKIIDKAYKAGITYFDTTWRNEIALLAEVIRHLNIRDKVIINGMVLGAFSGSKANAMDVCDYFNKWLDNRLEMIPDHRFDTFMINAIEEQFDYNQCESLIKLLDKRKSAGDFKLFGFSCHKPDFARKIADLYPEFQTIMVPYNFRNRKFEEAFYDYKGNAGIIIMKPLVWAEYGIPFCALNKFERFDEYFNFKPDFDIASRAIRFINNNNLVTSTVNAVNSIEEVEGLINAGSGAYTKYDEDILCKYNNIQTIEKGIPLFISALKWDNLRMNYFAALHMSKALGMDMPKIPLNDEYSKKKIFEYVEEIKDEIKKQGYGKYL